MRGRSVIEAGSLVARERVEDRFTGRQGDVGRQVIALTEGAIVAGSLVARGCMIRSTGGQNDEEIDHRIDSAIEAGSLVDLLIEEVDFGLAIVAGSLVARGRMIRFTGGQGDESGQTIALTMPLKQAHWGFAPRGRDFTQFYDWPRLVVQQIRRIPCESE